eukprot:CAMPEP_0117770396 /NCGR_PEP_ID=MMETSP0947-20121206/23747_1 /TAXON_ID=44440 /ORGANISM="Chattonella subsalsa, Strain CCMP2191" /LENGTH=347 /DNA_ID=CAMNT_0005595363 /DNA_START=101 /DNA_END=1144 /DNA_ORIENTATION=-
MNIIQISQQFHNDFHVLDKQTQDLLQKLSTVMMDCWLNPRSVIDAIQNQGKISLEGFLKMPSMFHLDGIGIEDAHNLFMGLDSNSNGALSSKQLKKILDVSEKEWLDQLAYHTFDDFGNFQPNDIKTNGIKSPRYIALIAETEMETALIKFVEKNLAFFRTVKLVTTQSTGGMLEERLGLNVDLKITLGPLGGDQELGALVSRGEVYCSFLFRDPLALAQTQMFDLLTYLKLCDIHNSMIATNPQSANKLMYALTRSPECKVELFKTENKSKPSQSNIIQLYKTRMKQIQTLNNDAIASSRSQQVKKLQIHMDISNRKFFSIRSNKKRKVAMLLARIVRYHQKAECL